MMRFQAITELARQDFLPLIEASAEEGYGFVQKLWDEYLSGENRFEQPGAVLLGAYDDDRMVAIGGVHPDPYLREPTIGRIRHVYVLPSHRRGGIGKRLVETLIAQASDHFTTFTLRTTTEHGHAFYTALGFTDQPRFPDATHWLEKRSD